jgi:hypothetical protein
VLAAFQIGGRDAAIHPGARRCQHDAYIPYIAVADQADGVVTVVAVSVGLWAVAVFATGVLGVNLFTATATVHGPTSASASILKAIRAKSTSLAPPPRINHFTRTHAHH